MPSMNEVSSSGRLCRVTSRGSVEGQISVPGGFYSKQWLTPHLTSHPNAFTPFLNPPPKSTLPEPQYTKHLPNPTPKYNPKHKATPKSHAEIPNTLQNTKHLPWQCQTAKHKKNRNTSLTPDLTTNTPPPLRLHLISQHA